ncbi:MAG: rRNA ((966)-N(2))-methyltransferase RsmD [Verrucomicrobiota bacterium]|jgi:16S rRNA (guanine966-N2)-methyltransferase
MRVISGSAGGIVLNLPKTDLRPTMDMVRGALFSSLSEAVVGARVLDLFAGSGSIGIEALSRGAAAVTFVESDRKACEVISQNLAKTRLRGEVLQADVFRFLETRCPPGGAHLIFADPPYSKLPGTRDFAAEMLDSSALPKALAPGGLLILEVMAGWKMPPAPGWECLRRKRYGSTETLLLRLASPEIAASPDTPPAFEAP